MNNVNMDSAADAVILRVALTRARAAGLSDTATLQQAMGQP